MLIMKLLLFISIIASITEGKKIRTQHNQIKFDKCSMIGKDNSKYTKHTKETNVPTKRNQSPDVILTNHILSQVLKKKIFTEIASDSCILQILDCFSPFSVTILVMSTFFSLTNVKHDTKLMTFRRKNPKIIYRCFDFLLLVVVIVLSRNVKNAI
jgi:hypothetical protein